METYKTVRDVDLKVWIFNPPGHEPTDRRAAAVFFFGGGWRGGNPAQFEQHCRHLAARGMVAMTIDSRDTFADNAWAIKRSLSPAAP